MRAFRGTTCVLQKSYAFGYGDYEDITVTIRDSDDDPAWIVLQVDGVNGDEIQRVLGGLGDIERATRENKQRDAKV